MAEEPEPTQIDLAGVAWPFCLLQLKNALAGLAPGQLLQTRVSDPMIFATIQQILSRSADRVLAASGSGDQYQIMIRKG